MTNWKVYYSDGSTYIGDVENTPIFGVLVIVEMDPDHGRRLVSGGDYYCWYPEEERWRKYDFIGMIQYLAKPGMKRVLVGEMVDNEAWNSTYRRAEADVDFPLRTAYSYYEEKGER